MGRLIVVPTPIGNLEDMTFRGVRVLREVGLILAEDTRHTRTLLSHYGISTRLLSYHEHNRRSRLPLILARLAEEDIALVSDAGTPGLSDPGSDLIAELVRHGETVEVLPGASAVTTAAVLSGFTAEGFLFVGFLPRKGKDRRESLQRLATLPYPVVLYEAPSRVAGTLADLAAALGDREAVVARELTKLHEEVTRGSLPDLRDTYATRQPRGEITIVVAGSGEPEPEDTVEALDALRRLHADGYDRRTAVETVMEQCGLSRNAAYQLWLLIQENEPGA